MQNWADEMIQSYQAGKAGLRVMKEELGNTGLDCSDKTQVNSMISDMDYSLEWLKNGRRPGNHRGVDRRSAYQRRALIDMDLFPSLDIMPAEKELSEESKEAIANVLVLLSYRERQCYLLHMAQGLSLQEIADELGLAKRTVQQYVDRAKNKVKEKMLKVS